VALLLDQFGSFPSFGSHGPKPATVLHPRELKGLADYIRL